MREDKADQAAGSVPVSWLVARLSVWREVMSATLGGRLPANESERRSRPMTCAPLQVTPCHAAELHATAGVREDQLVTRIELLGLATSNSCFTL